MTNKEVELLEIFSKMDFDELSTQAKKYQIDGSGKWSEEFERKCCSLLSKKLFNNTDVNNISSVEESLDNWFDNLEDTQKHELLEDLDMKEYHGYVC